MFKTLSNYLLLILAVATFSFVSCGDDDDGDTNKITYDLNEFANSDVSGDIEFLELENGNIQAEISLSGTNDGESHPAHVHMNSAALGGDILISLEPVAGATGSSVTIIEALDNGDAFTFSMIDGMDAYVNIHKSSSDLGTLIAQGDIGGNILTGEEKSYNLDERAVEGISGSVTFKERKNGFVLAEIDLDGTPDDGMHPAHIHANSFAETGGILYTFTPVDGTTGKSVSGIRTLDDGSDIDFQDIQSLNGYVNVHLSMNDLATVVAQGDIGSNELTGEEVSYDLNEKDIAGISGEVKFEERKDGSVMATITLSGTPDGASHPAHIHENSADEGGDIVVSFTPVDGTTGMSITSIRSTDDGSAFNYTLVDNFDGYVNVHKSAAELSVLAAQGNIGLNN